MGQFQIDSSQLPPGAIESQVDTGQVGAEVTSLTIHGSYPVRVLLVPATKPSAQNPDRAAATITIGQPWDEAEAIALHMGYELRDASNLEILPKTDGTYLELPEQWRLLILRNPKGNSVASLALIDNWQGIQAVRNNHEIRSFDLPPAILADR